MHKNTPPLPQPAGATCSNCGAAQSVSAPFCTACGAARRAATAGLSTGAKVISSLALGCGALFFGALGGCFFLMGADNGGITIAVTILVVLGFLVGIFLVLRK